MLTIDSTPDPARDSLSAREPGEARLMAAEEQMRARVVGLILDSKPEEAIKVLSRWYRVSEPGLGIGVVEGKTKRVAAVYSQRTKKILAARREFLFDPFVMIHEFYHHLRSAGGRHRGTERQADRFALDFIESYRQLASGHEGGQG